MEHKTPQDQRVKYTGRFATEADSKPPRAAAPVRPRAPRAQAQTGHRPSGFAPAEPPKRRPAPRPAAPKVPEKPKREKRIRNKRRQRPKYGWGWKLPLLIALIALVLLTIIFVLIFGGHGGTHHQLPKVERGSTSDFSAAETNDPQATNGMELSAATEAPASNGEAAFDETDNFNEADFLDDAAIFGGAEDFDAPGFFGDADSAEDAKILNVLLALEGANQ